MTDDETPRTPDEEEKPRTEKFPPADYRFPPLVPPAEPIEATMALVDAKADLVMHPCKTCNATLTAPHMQPGSTLPRAWDIRHEPGCPLWVPDV
ncbi:MAG: hypothetical protein QOH55_1806 [Microbacteriaceae bacterium]|nr:hypothetical protein [Microbacteriaceae bacterium]